MDEINIPQVVDLIRSTKTTSRQEAIALLTAALRVARSGGEADAARAASESMMRAYDEATARAFGRSKPA